MELGSFKNFLKSYENGVYDFTVNGKCSQCGNCCSNILSVTEKELSIIRNYVNVNNIKPVDHTKILNNCTFDMVCPFLDTAKEKEKCRIYQVRPRICRDFTCSKDRIIRKESVSYLKNCMDVFLREEIFGERM